MDMTESDVAIGGGEQRLRLVAHGGVSLSSFRSSLNALEQLYVAFGIVEQRALGYPTIDGNDPFLDLRLLEAWNGSEWVVRELGLGSTTLAKIVVRSVRESLQIEKITVASPGFIQIKGNGSTIKQLRLFFRDVAGRRSRAALDDEIVIEQRLENLKRTRDILWEELNRIDESSLPSEFKNRMMADLIEGPLNNFERNWDNRVIDAGSAELVEENEPFPTNDPG